MKLKLLFAITFLLLVSACDDDNGSFTQVKDTEFYIYQNIKDFRESEGLTGPFVHQFLMVREAQLYSYKMANDFEEVGTQGLQEHWNTLDEKYGFYNKAALVLKSASGDEDQIFSELLQIEGADSIMLGDLTQCGVGVETDTDGMYYVTVLLAKADSR
jgi:hypothetical protein